MKANTEESCGHSFSASTISALNKSLDGTLEKSPPEQPYPYPILDVNITVLDIAYLLSEVGFF